MKFENIKAEQTLIGLMLINPLVMPKVLYLKEADFTEALHGRIFKAITNGYAKGINETPTSLASHFNNDEVLKNLGGAKYLFNLAKLAINSEDPAPLAHDIRECAVKRELWSICNSMIARLESSDDTLTEPEVFLTDMARELQILESGYVEEVAKSSHDVIRDIIESFKYEPEIFKTGLNLLDQAMGGGMIAGKAYGLSARKKAGKTATMATIAQNLNENGYKTLYVALEMGKEQIMHRIIGRGIKKNPVDFLTEERKSDSFQQSVVGYMRQDKGNLNFLDLAAIGFDRLKLMLTSYVRRKKIRIIIIDYWQLIGGQRRGQSRAEFLDEIAQWFAEFAKQENVAILMASQTNQEGNTRGSEGMRLAFDQVYQLHPCETQEGCLWVEMMDTRYTPWNNLGDENKPAFKINPMGVFIEEIK